jgi:hypothetical protein
VATVLKQELGLSEVYSRYLNERSPKMATQIDDLAKAIALGAHATEELKKSHVKEHTRTSASGAISQVSAYDDKRKAAEQRTKDANKAQSKMDLDKPSDALQTAGAHSMAAEAHIEAMKEAHKSSKGNAAINEHYYAASRHLQADHSLRSFHQENAEAHARLATVHANFLSSHAHQHKGEDDSESLNHGSSIHMLAKEAHGRAAEAHMALANKHFGTEKGEKHAEKARGHRDGESLHGKEVQRLSKISIDARDKAHAASTKAESSSSAEDHKKAAEAHHEAARLDYDSETKAAHEKQAEHHDKKSTPAADPGEKLAELKSHKLGGPTFSQKILHHGKETGTGHEEIARMSSALHASDVATSKESHARAYFEHTAAADKAKNPVYKKCHEESAAHHKKAAGLED